MTEFAHPAPELDAPEAETPEAVGGGLSPEAEAAAGGGVGPDLMAAAQARTTSYLEAIEAARVVGGNVTPAAFPAAALAAAGSSVTAERYAGKVRDVWRLSDGRAVLIATGRQSAFDRALATIPFKVQQPPHKTKLQSRDDDVCYTSSDEGVPQKEQRDAFGDCLPRLVDSLHRRALATIPSFSRGTCSTSPRSGGSSTRGTSCPTT